MYHGSGGDDSGTTEVAERIGEGLVPLLDPVTSIIIIVLVENPALAAVLTGLLLRGDNPDDEPSEDRQPNPEGDDGGGPIKGDSNDTLDWLAGRSPRSRNPATAPRIGKLDVLGQPDSEKGRYPAAAPNRFARMRDDIDPAMMSSGADGGGTGGGSEGCPIGPDPNDPDSPIGPGDPSPVE